MKKKDNDFFMQCALREAQKAAELDEVPIGCIVVKNNKIISRGHNLREKMNDPTYHAEIVAIRKACKKIKDWQLIDCSIYITLEPCIMCAGVILQSRIKNVVFGAYDPKGGAFGSSIDVLKAQNINHRPLVIGGIKQLECSEIIKNYFKNKRNKNKT